MNKIKLTLLKRRIEIHDCYVIWEGFYMEQVITIQSSQVELSATLHLPQHRSPGSKFPLVIICHGFVGNRIGVNRLFVKASRQFAAHGLAVLRFDYEGCGESFGEYGSYGLDRFIQQTKDVIDYAEGIRQVDQDQIFLLGHSLGGAIATLTASQDQRIKGLITWAAVGHPFHDIVKIVGKEKVQEYLSHPYVDYEGFALTKRFFDSLAEYSPMEAAKLFSGDVMVLHGSHDEDIPVDYCTQYHHTFKRGKSKSCVKEVISGADHTFSSVQGSNHLYGSTLEWLQSHTKKSNQSDYRVI